MLARLWWKEWRSLAPIAAVLAGSAVVVQWFLLHYGGRDIREGGILVPLGLGWAMLYAFVAAASSFAGERENRTLGLLDALPVDRRTLWVGKATFALASSVVLAVILVLMGAIGSARPLLNREADATTVLFGAFALAWAVASGLFWSAYCRNAITAGVLAVVATGLMPSAIERWLSLRPSTYLGYQNFGPGPVSAAAVLGHLALIGAVLGASWWVVVREVAPRSRRRPSFAFATRPIRLRPAILDRAPRLPFLPSAAFGRVAWQTFREGRSTWLGTVGLALLLPTAESFGGGFGNDSGAMEYGLVLLALLIQGASVFGLENAAGTRQFLDNMAVPPRTAWAAKVFAWGLGLVAFLAVLVAASVVASVPQGNGRFLLRGTRDWTEAVILVVGAVNALAVGMVAGMALTRRITAVLVATLAGFALAIPQFALIGAHLAPAWGLAVVPTILVAATFCWAGDWLAVRPGWRRWARLAGLVAVPLAATFPAYVGGRAWGLPDVGPQFDASAGRGPSPLAGDYLRIRNALGADGSSVVAADGRPLVPSFDWRDGSPALRPIREHLAANAANLAEVRRLAARPDAAWFGPARSLLEPGAVTDWFPTRTSLLWHLAMEAAERRERGDVAGAWDDILAQVRLEGQFARGASSAMDYDYSLVNSGWTGQAIAWATDPRTPLAAIRAAKAALEAVGEPPSVAEAIRAGSRRVERDLDRPTDDWVDYLQPPNNSGGGTPWGRIAHSWLSAPSWERERTRRALRLAAVVALREAAVPRTQRAYPTEWDLSSGGKSALRTPLAQMLMREVFGADDARDFELTNRRAMVTFLALRAWQLTHDGVAPATLDRIVPAELAALPVDPYSRDGSPFGYGPVERPPGYRDARGVQTDPLGPLPEPFSTFVLYSVGPDGVIQPVELDGSARFLKQGVESGARWLPMADDLTYPLPPNPPGTTPAAKAEPPAATPAP